MLAARDMRTACLNVLNNNTHHSHVSIVTILLEFVVMKVINFIEVINVEYRFRLQ